MTTSNATDALQNLRDIHLPQSGGWWPPAPGWWVLFALLLLCLAGAGLWWRRRQRHNRRWLAAQRELTLLRAQPQATAAWFSQLNALLKRAARDCYPQQPIAALSGRDWAAFLSQSMDGHDDLASARPDEYQVVAMVNDCWRPISQSEPQQALDIAERWLKTHKKQLRRTP